MIADLPTGSHQLIDTYSSKPQGILQLLRLLRLCRVFAHKVLPLLSFSKRVSLWEYTWPFHYKHATTISKSKHYIGSLIHKPFIKLHRLWAYMSAYKFQDARCKHLSEITLDVTATTERGAHFHSTVGSMTPNGFTTSHPRAETILLRDCVSVCQWPRMKVTLLLLCYHSLCIFPKLFLSSFPRVCPVITHSSGLFSFQRGCV